MQQATSSAPLLVIRGLVVEGRSDQGVSQIIQTMDLTLERGKVLGLIGESGAGKSTLGLAAMGFTRDGCRIAAGSIVFDGTDLAQADENTRRHLRRTRIAYVAQSAAASFNPALRLIDQAVETTVQEGGASRKEAVERAIDLYHRLRLPNPDEIGFRYPHQVSGGQLQRAMTAMALVARPDLIIFDEPTTALDVTTQIGVLTAIRDAVRETGTAAIYISHDLALVAQMADRIMVLRHGQLVEEADTCDMMRATRAHCGRYGAFAPRPRPSLHQVPRPCCPCAPSRPPMARCRYCTECRWTCTKAAQPPSWASPVPVSPRWLA